MEPQQKQALIRALINGELKDIKNINKELKGEVVIIHDFYEHLKFTNTIGRKPEDFNRVEIAPGQYRDALEKLNTDSEGKLSPRPVWWISADSLNDEEIQAYMDG